LTIRFTLSDQIAPYLKDASQFSGTADQILLPESEKEISEILKEANAGKIPVTVSAGRTGLAGGAVPLGGWVLSMEKLSKIIEVRNASERRPSWVRTEPALFLKDLDRALEPKGLFYPPDPTGPKALLGGTVATNASGPNSFKYGPTRPYVRRIRVVLAEGEVLDLPRGRYKAGWQNILQIPLRNRILKIPIPRYGWPTLKHTGGYFVSRGLDAVDLFIGSEGTLGVVTEIELLLLPRPRQVLAWVVFFQREEEAWDFAKRIRAMSRSRILEYFDRGSLEFLRPGFPSIPQAAQACLFIEQEVEEGQITSAIRRKWQERFEQEKGVEAIWEGESPEKQREFREFRSALPLAVREFLAEHAQVKVGTDTCVPHERFEELVLFHRRLVGESGLVNVTFGHIGESHVHLNLLPKNDTEAEKARALYPKLVRKALALGGTFSAEHGVGKLKRGYFQEFFGEAAAREMLAIKQTFDSNLILGRGTLFEVE